MNSHLFLVGYRGSGKSTIARRLGEILKLSVADSDEVVERAAGKSIRAIFSDQGEQCFRDLETQAIEQITAFPLPNVVSLGGGAILRERNRSMIKAHGKVAWLDASAEEIARRIAQDTMTSERRPALTRLTGNDEIVELLAIRKPLYGAVADVTFQTDDRTVDDIALEIANWFAEQQRPVFGELAS